MLGSALLNQQQHIGLQTLSSLAGLAHSSLGPCTTYTFIQEGLSREAALVGSSFRLVQTLEPACGVGQLVSETLRAHHKVYRSGTGCLLFLAGAWSRAALESLRRGVPVPHIISIMSEGMEVCSQACRSNSISINSITGKTSVVPPDPLRNPAGCPPQGSSPLRGTSRDKNTHDQRGLKIKLTHSRHFCESRCENFSTDPRPGSQESELVCITRVAETLCHGRVNAMKLAMEAAHLQSKIRQDGSRFALDLSKVLTCILPGSSEEKARVLPGCVVRLSPEQVLVARLLEVQQLKVALIDGDLGVRFRHLGFRKPKDMKHFTDNLDSGSSSKEDEWTEKVLSILLKLNVTLVLLTGAASENLTSRCFSHHLLVVEKLKLSILKAFAEATGAIVVTYVTQLSARCVGAGAQVTLWTDVSCEGERPLVAANIYTSRNLGLVTAVLTSCIQGKMQALEDEFWGCAYRLHGALEDGAVLPGAGALETLCIRDLQRKAERHMKLSAEVDGDPAQQTEAEAAGDPYRGDVLRLMADGLTDYISTVMVNSGRFSKLQAWTAVRQEVRRLEGLVGGGGEFSGLWLETEAEDRVSSSDGTSSPTGVKVCDNLNVKLEVWRKALDLVFLVLQTDAEVITGLDLETPGAHAEFMLL